MVSWSATGVENFSRTYTYDELDRLKTMTSAPCSLFWTYDAWANRTAQTVTGGTCGQSQMTVSNFNKIADPGFQYDPAGNMTAEPGKNYQFDAENRMISINGGSVGAYVYDAGGRRVRKTVASGVTDYFYDLSGNVVAERQAGVWTKAYVYAEGQLVAQYSDSTTYFVHKDHLGSTRMLTTVSQAVFATFDYQPFGESIGSGSATTHKFTGKERDDESGLDDFGARYYSSHTGASCPPTCHSSVRTPATTRAGICLPMCAITR